jgi:hypothetical protein
MTLLEAVKMDTLSESLDSAMVLALRKVGKSRDIDWPAYVAAYRACGRKKDREQQITLIDKIGKTLDRLTRMPLIHFPQAHERPRPPGRAGRPAFLPATRLRRLQRHEGADEFLAIVTERETTRDARR